MTGGNPTRVLLFLGAGASSQFEVPLTPQLISGYQSSASSAHRTRIDTVMALLRSFSVGDSLENLLTILDYSSNPSNLRDRIGPIIPLIAQSPSAVNIQPNSEDGVIVKEIRDYVFRKCFIKDPEPIKRIDAFYHSLLSGLASYFESARIGSTPYIRAPIFTTNFDNGVELFASRNGVAIFDGYDRLPAGVYAFNHKLYDTEFNLNSIRLYKIHGTVRFVRNPRGEFDELTLLPETPEIRIHGEICIPELIYSESYQYTSNSPQLELLYCMREELAIADRVVVIGYSFPDPHVRTVFREVLGKRQWQGKLVVCTRNPQSVIDSRFSEIVSKCVGVPCDASNLDVSTAFTSNRVPK